MVTFMRDFLRYDTLMVDLLGGIWKRLIFCGLEAQVAVVAMAV